MGTTTAGLPYPETTDDLREGAEAIQALAEALDLQGTVGEPVSVAMVSGVTGFITATRVGGLIVVDIEATTSFPQGGTVTVSTDDGVPDAMCPTTGTKFGLAYMSGGYAGIAYLGTDGIVRVIQREATTARTQARALVIYPAPEVGG